MSAQSLCRLRPTRKTARLRPGASAFAGFDTTSPARKNRHQTTVQQREARRWGRKRSRQSPRLGVAAIASSGAAMAQAESYPDRPIHFVAPYNRRDGRPDGAGSGGSGRENSRPAGGDREPRRGGGLGRHRLRVGRPLRRRLALLPRRPPLPLPAAARAPPTNGGRGSRPLRAERRRATGRMPATAGTAKSPGCRSPASARRC
jgi:hypothetical protein